MNIQTSTAFDKQARKTVFAIIVFVFTYLIMLIGTIGITIGFGAFGIWLVAVQPMFLTAVAGLILVASGFLTLVYLVRYVFSTTKVDTSNLIEIRKDDEPELFNFIREIAVETGARFPKKIFLSPDVNASVFYNSSFWSMFVPTRKNLAIGFGLINTVSKQELKAIIAHEFGHFSQKSMRVGSYVYHVNQIIYNMVNKNDAAQELPQNDIAMYNYIAIIKKISAFMIEAIQEVLKSLYKYVNINYMALSREMEFHADEVAANIAGSEALCESLLRLELSNHALESVLLFYEERAKSNIVSSDIYQDHQVANHFLALENGLFSNNGLPVININVLGKYNRSKLNIDDQWASHPSTKDRINAISRLNIVKPEKDDTLATTLFKDKNSLATLITNRIFSVLKHDSSPQTISLLEFESQYIKSYKEYVFDKSYNDFYYMNAPIINDIESIEMDVDPDYTDLFTDDKVEMTYELTALKNDSEFLQQIQNQNIEIKTFDYDGKKYHAYEAYPVQQQLDREIVILQGKVDLNNILVYQYYYKLAGKQHMEDKLKNEYLIFNKCNNVYHDKIKLYDDLVENTQFLFQTTPFDEISARLNDLLKFENQLKLELQHLIVEEMVTKDIDKDILDSLVRYCSEKLEYFYVDTYNNENMQVLLTAISTYLQLINRQYFVYKKNILDLQKQLEQSHIEERIAY